MKLPLPAQPNSLLPWLILVLVFAAPDVSFGQTLHETTVFEAHTEGYHTYRVPVIIRAQDGMLLAFAEGRKHNASDTGDIDIVLKRSVDGGQTWGPLIIAAEAGPHTVGNASPILDRDTGRIVLLCNQNLGQDDQREISSATGDGTRTAWVCHSDDHGLTWSPLIEITAQVKHPDWRWYAFGPAHGIQLTRGKHAGRLLVGAVQNGPNSNGIHGVFSDDGGYSWQHGTGIEASGEIRPSESVVVELTDGRIQINSRNRGGHERTRATAYSSDGGETFSTPGLAKELIDPTVQGSTLRLQAIDEGDEQNQILFSNPAHINARRQLTVRSSFDETETWTRGKLIHRGPSAYSDLVEIDQTAAGVVYEHGIDARYERVNFASWPTGWLEDPTLVEFDFNNLPDDKKILSTRGHALQGQVEGSPTLITSDTSDNHRTALHLDQSDQLVRLEDQPHHLLDFENQDSFTIEAVFRTTAHAGEQVGAILSKDKGKNAPSYWLRIEAGQIRFFICDGDSAVSVIGGSNLCDGEWHHVTAVRDTDKWQLRLYLDHKLVDQSSDTTHKALANDSDLLIGNFNNSRDRQFHGEIDVLRIYGAAMNPSELTPKE